MSESRETQPTADNPVSLEAGWWAATGGRIARAGRYDEEGRLVEVVEAGEDGRVDIPTSGLWYVQVVAE